MSLADRALHRLLERGERARLRQSDRAIRESFKAPESPFWSQSLDERDAFHRGMRQAEAAGAVRLEWSRQGGDDRTLDAVQLIDLDRLVAHLGATTRGERARHAAERLGAWAERYPRVGEILDAWTRLKPVRGLTPADAGDLEDAIGVLVELESRGAKDQVLRAFSASLFGDSKRVEALSRHLDLLTAESLTAPARPDREVFDALGLLKAALPFLVTGRGVLELAGGIECPVVAPYVGVAPEVVAGFRGSPGWVMTVENLTTFHQVAAALQPHAGGLAIYTGGMPSPGWCRAYRGILGALPEHVPVYHWGDVDEGGFRIAAHLRERCVGQRSFEPWLMEATPACAGARTTGQSTWRSMRRGAERAGWHALAERLPALTLEQEALAATLPEEPARA